MKTEVARKEQIVTSDVIVAFSPHHIGLNGSIIRRINSSGAVGCFTKPVSKGIHRLSIRNAGTDGIMFGVLDAAEYPKHLTTTVHTSPKAAMMYNATGLLYSADRGIVLNTKPRDGQEWSAEADLAKRTLHFFVNGVLQPHYFINVPVPLVFAIDTFFKDVPIEITFWGELKKSNVTNQGTGHNLG
ncbi:hypothetical protein BLNAU_20706 [Blattamonas nauphoetae]|uniref:SPRY domain-containing protein n=1 Tax=Blattamonas nauphoetae TaxID=2049346 RepID=A0ABQ9WXW7_9EUKA|nr:hypothetical protein BLNAU_20706 [Blattamonas nauphoetae]